MWLHHPHGPNHTTNGFPCHRPSGPKPEIHEEACRLWAERKKQWLLGKVKVGVVVLPKRKLWDLKRVYNWNIVERAIRSCSVLCQLHDYDLKIRSWLSLLYQFLGRDKLLLRDPGLKIHVMVFIPSTCSSITSRVSSRIWRGAMWRICHLRADSVVWLSHTSSIWPWSGEQKVWLYDTFLGGLHHLPPGMKNKHGLNEEKTFLTKKSLNWVLVM